MTLNIGKSDRVYTSGIAGHYPTPTSDEGQRWSSPFGSGEPTLAMMADDPGNWRIDVPQTHIDLYLELLSEPRSLTADEARMMVELVDGWRALEHRKYIALMSKQGADPHDSSRLPL